MHVLLEDTTGEARGLKPCMVKAARFLARHEGWGDCRVNVLVGGDDLLRQLNRDFRGFDRTTDVLSFPMQEPDEDGVLLAGDIAISTQAARRRSPLPLRQEIVRLFIHGLLHLFGHDHKKKKEADLMHQLTEEAFAHSGAALLA